MRLDRSWIESHIPHKGGMCLLDEVVSWNENEVRCRSASHRSADNPLRADGRLGSACAIEYAAQAMAVHGALMASLTGNLAPAGLLASVRGVELLVKRLDDIGSDLIARVQRLSGDPRVALYEFAVSADEAMLSRGRAVIAFDNYDAVGN
ncbi:MAG TPA: hypothetical protein VIY54_04255 [Steroidobacteraceae bacterium]